MLPLKKTGMILTQTPDKNCDSTAKGANMPKDTIERAKKHPRVT